MKFVWAFFWLILKFVETNRFRIYSLNKHDMEKEWSLFKNNFNRTYKNYSHEYKRFFFI